MAHFEIYVSDIEAGKAFYGQLYGWTFSPMDGGEEVNYHLAESAGLGEGLTIGMMTRPDTPHTAGSAVRGGTMTFDVSDCDESYNWALANGGAEALPPMDYPGVGRCAYVEDGQGNIVGMISPAKGSA
ncbi:VOC family protein [Roseovarius sp. EL26]|uniref:VOC family protein n=1 Tax=Roseovarius sp. EL26 TaxID=2126672 RepID=UPI000EA2FE22|nr:VOC family protein [Roseovarius sp. EL26]